MQNLDGGKLSYSQKSRVDTRLRRFFACSTRLHTTAASGRQREKSRLSPPARMENPRGEAITSGAPPQRQGIMVNVQTDF